MIKMPREIQLTKILKLPEGNMLLEKILRETNGELARAYEPAEERRE
jgi:hypothetical protein